MKRKFELYRSIRIFLASVSFVLLTGAVWFLPGVESLFGWQFGSGVLKLFADWTLGATAAVLSILILTLLLGRAYCSVLCPLGILQDIMSVFRRPYRVQKDPRILKYSLFFLLTGMAAVGFLLPLALLLPSSNFVMIINQVFRESAANISIWLKFAAGPVSMKPAVGAMVFSWALFVVLLVLVRWKGRIYCNSLCPVGTLLGFVSRFSLFRITLGEKCVSCGACERVCKASCIDLAGKRVRTEDCVMCMNCVGKCPVGVISLQRRSSSVAVPPVASRREFLLVGGTLLGGVVLGKAAVTGLKNPSKTVMPPGAGTYDRFASHCVGCGLCIGSCRGKVLFHSVTEYGMRGFMQPHLDYNKGYCQFDCRRCMEVCPTGALRLLSPEDKRRWRIGLASYVKERCVAYLEDTDCGACAEHCPVGALDMIPYKNTLIPKVNEAICIGCGACQNICPARPVQAIIVNGISPQVFAVKKVSSDKPASLEAEKDFPF